MKKNFSVNQAVGLSCEGHYFDLHNYYDFQGFDFDVAGKTFCLKFTRTSESQELKQKVSIKFVGIDAFELSDDFVAHINRNLLELGYKSADDRDHDWLVGEDDSLPQDHLFFRFEADQYIRVHGRWATVKYQ